MSKAQEQETSADMIAEMRYLAANRDWHNHTNQSNRERILYIADRLEAALKREKIKIEADALAVGGIVEAERHKRGNAAALRHALIIIYDWILKAGYVHGYPDTKQKRRQLYDMITKALAASPRNCDRFGSKYDADKLHEAFVKHCNECDCPMGCIHRRDTRCMLDTRCGSILKCFAEFVLSKTKGESK